MRRLPIFFVIDVSESMIGEPIELMEKGIENIVSSLRQDPHSLETVYISIIAFAGKAKAITPLVDLISFYPPKIAIGGGTSLGGALDVLMGEIDQNVQKTTMETRGDWKPVVFLITDGKPTDDPNPAMLRWNNKYAKDCNVISVTLGLNADVEILNQISDAVLALENTEENAFFKFIEWISHSVKAQSQAVDLTKKSTVVSLEKIDKSGLQLVESNALFNAYDNHCVTFTGRCSTNKKPYLMKYMKPKLVEGMERFIKNQCYHLEGAYVLEESYFDWSSRDHGSQQVDTSVLDGFPSCPQCGNQTAFALCQCGKLLCVGQEPSAICPWCNKHLAFSQGGADFSVNRGQG